MLTIKNLHASVHNNQILRGVNLTINAGEVHAIMGPNGSGKSTLASVLAGREDYAIVDGDVRYFDEDLFELSPEDRAAKGLFLAFNIRLKSPVSIIFIF